MGVGIGLSENNRIYIGSDIDKVLKSLDDNNVEYKKSYDRTKCDGTRETIVDIPSDRITLEFKNNELEYIRLNPCEISHLVTHTGKEQVGTIKEIRDLAVKKLNLDGYNVTFLKIDFKQMYLVMKIEGNEKDNNKYRVAIQRDGLNRVYIATMSVLRG